MNTMQQVSVGAWEALLWLAGPALALTFLLGLAISMVQAVTQIQESSLSFAPKFAALLALIALAGGAMFHGLTDYATQLYHALPVLVGHG